ncbi:hypothetical protein, partial [Granulicatella sp. zg-ZJ]|uniref:hypothetical protein n=1 Tax=Granulicatella sp. zg-ZJ TaxID=2678504 RepID=UPI001967EE6A
FEPFCYLSFYNHSKQHSSKTVMWKQSAKLEFYNHSKQHSSKTSEFCSPVYPQTARSSKTSVLNGLLI